MDGEYKAWLVVTTLWGLLLLATILGLSSCGAVARRVDDVCDRVAEVDDRFADAYETASDAGAPKEVMDKLDRAGEVIVEVHGWCYR